MIDSAIGVWMAPGLVALAFLGGWGVAASWVAMYRFYVKKAVVDVGPRHLRNLGIMASLGAGNALQYLLWEPIGWTDFPMVWRRVAWIGLAVSVLDGVCWLVFRPIQAQSDSRRTRDER